MNEPSDRFRELPERVRLEATVEEVASEPPPEPDPGVPQPDREWFSAGG